MMREVSRVCHPEGWKLPSRTEHHIKILFLAQQPPKSGLFQGFAYFFSLGENTWVRCNFITQAKSVAISVWCARIVNPRGQLIGKTMANFPRCPLSFHFTALFDYNANTG